MNAKDRLLIFLDHLNMGQNAFEKKVGIGNGYISHNKGSLGSDVVAKIYAAYPDLNLVWLLTGEGEMIKSTPAAVAPNPAAGADAITIPLAVWDVIQKQLEEKDRQIAGLIAGNGAGKERRTFVVTEEEGMAALG